MNSRDRIERVEALLGHVFGDRALAIAALTHPSHATETAGAESYERLEFLGDSVLGFIVADELFRHYTESPEGVLTRRKIAVVSGERLAAVAAEAGLEELLLFGKGEARAGTRGRTSVLENALEALVGAVYLDAGLEAARGVVLRLLGHVLSLEDIAAEDDAKSTLQEITQARGDGLPQYVVTESSGPAHAPRFTVEVRLAGHVLGTGSGRSKKEAEKAAARAALEAVEAG